MASGFVEGCSSFRCPLLFRLYQVTAVTPSDQLLSLTVTHDHLALRYASADDVQGELVETADLRTGDMILVYHAVVGALSTPGNRQVARVVSVTPNIPLDTTNQLATQAGTVLADGHLTTAICDGLNGVPTDLRGPGRAAAALAVWVQLHSDATDLGQ